MVRKRNQSEASSNKRGCLPNMDPVESERLSRSVKEGLERYGTYVTPTVPLIYRVPAGLQELDAEAYKPKAFSIGPYHHGKEDLQEMEKTKWRYLSIILRRNSKLTVEDYIEEIRSLERDVRSSYPDQVSEMKSIDFIKMLLLDACFLLCVLGAANEEDNNITATSPENSSGSTAAPATEDSHHVHRQPYWSYAFFLHDICLLENQLPFFVLEKIYELAFPNSDTNRLVVSITNMLRGSVLLGYTDATVDLDGFRPNHLLHICYHIFCSTRGSNEKGLDQHIQISDACGESENPDSRGGGDIGLTITMPNALELWKSGIMFRKGSRDRLLNITFQQGVLDIPCLYIDSNTNSLFRNLIAYEQSISEQVFTSFVLFFSNLVNTEADVKLLRRMGFLPECMIIDKEASDVLSMLTMKLIFVPGELHLSPVFKSVNHYAGIKRHRWWAWIRHKYNNPWLILSLITGVTVLLCTIIQTVYAMQSNTLQCLCVRS